MKSLFPSFTKIFLFFLFCFVLHYSALLTIVLVANNTLFLTSFFFFFFFSFFDLKRRKTQKKFCPPPNHLLCSASQFLLFKKPRHFDLYPHGVYTQVNKHCKPHDYASCIIIRQCIFPHTIQFPSKKGKK